MHAIVHPPTIEHLSGTVQAEGHYKMMKILHMVATQLLGPLYACVCFELYSQKSRL